MKITKIALEPAHRVVGMVMEDSWQYTIYTYDYKAEGRNKEGYPSRHEKQEGSIADNSSTTLLEALHKLILELEHLERRE